MDNLIVKVPALTDEAAANMEEFFLALMSAFSEHYYYQIKRHYDNSRPDSDSEIVANNLFICEDDPPF